jgi:hypothetical protein
MEYVDIFATGTNAKKYKIGFEVTQQRTEMLNGLVLTNNTVIPTDINTDNLSYDIFEYVVPEDYHYFIRGMIKTKCGTFSTTPKQHDDVNSLLKGYHTLPSVPWKRFPSLIARSTKSENKAFFVHVPNGLAIEEFQLTYIKKPRKVFIGGYDTLEYISGNLNAYNSTTPAVHSEIDEDYTHVLVDIAVDIVARILNDTQSVQLTQDKLIQQY